MLKLNVGYWILPTGSAPFGRGRNPDEQFAHERETLDAAQVTSCKSNNNRLQ